VKPIKRKPPKNTVKKPGGGSPQKGITRYRRAFGFYTDEAETYIVYYHGKRRFFRVQGIDPTRSNRSRTQNQFIRMKLFHLLYPENSIRPVGVSYIEMAGSKQWGVVSEILKNRSPGYKKYHARFYYDKIKKVLDLNHSDFSEHHAFVNRAVDSVFNRIYEESGFHVQTHPANVVDVHGKPVFIEVFSPENNQYISKVERLITTRLQGAQKKEALSLLKQLKKIK
jgi:hypothetical protein